MSAFVPPIPGMPALPPGAPGGPVSAAAGSPVPGLPSLPPALTAPRFPPTSRYSGIPMAVTIDASGRTHPYLCRRFVPDPADLAAIGTYGVQDGDRLDRVAAATLGDPEQFWRLCDGNRAVDPLELEAPVGRILRITLPAGVPAPQTNA